MRTADRLRNLRLHSPLLRRRCATGEVAAARELGPRGHVIYGTIRAIDGMVNYLIYQHISQIRAAILNPTAIATVEKV
jgi:hypothetical protein